MHSQRKLFFQHLTQTSLSPLALEIISAQGNYLYDTNKKKYLDLISGISVSNLGHANKKINSAIKKQLDSHSHVMVFGEFIQSAQVEYAKLLAHHLPENLQSVYFVNSGAEAVEGALKLAKRFTGRTEIIAFKNAYHGSTHGALSVMGDEILKQPFRPLLPDVRFIEFNNEKHLKQITHKTACVIVEPIQAEAGVILPENSFLKKLRERCNQTETLLVFDEIQTGMGRTGKLFAFEHYRVVPDVLCLAKAFGGGMPLGAFISSKKIMSSLSDNPPLGHITTFGGHPVCCAAGMAAFEQIKTIIKDVEKKGELFQKYLRHKKIISFRGKGLLIALEFKSEEINKKIITRCIKNGVITDWFLFNAKSMRIAPPLIISESEIINACKIIVESIERVGQ